MVEAYNCMAHLKKYLGDTNRVFNEVGIYPRQLNIYPPSDHETACNFRCFYCCGLLQPKELAAWEHTGLRLLDNLRGMVPYHIYSGLCTETLMNPFLMSFLKKTKEYGNGFGIKTNGSRMIELEEQESFLTTMCNISDTEEDYFSVSLDAGFAASHSKTKRVDPSVFQDIIDGMNLLGKIRGSKHYPVLRVSYLINNVNDSEEEIVAAIDLTNKAGFDSIRFSQPHPYWGTRNKSASRWWKRLWQKDAKYQELFGRFDNRMPGKAVAFYVSPCHPPTDGYEKCAYGYYQMTLSHDGHLYKCTSVATSKFHMMRLGTIPSDTETFLAAVVRNQNIHFDPEECFKRGAYCCRAGVAVNNYFNPVCLLV